MNGKEIKKVCILIAKMVLEIDKLSKGALACLNELT